MPLIVWTPLLATGIESIDLQHRKLINYLNDLYAASCVADHAAADQVLAELLDYTLYHFDHEEKVLSELGYPTLDSHLNQHHAMERRVAALRKACAEGDAQAFPSINTFVAGWINAHLIGSDLRMREFLAQKNPAQSGVPAGRGPVSADP